MKKLSLFLFCAVSIIILSSCNSIDENNTLTYKPEPPVKIADYEIKNNLFLPEIPDKRTLEQEVTYKINADPYILIPLWPWSHSNIDPILRFSYFQNPLPLILLGLIDMDLKASGLFKNIYISPVLYSIRKNKSYRLNVELLEANWSRNLTSYGLSYPGTILWAIGFPVSYGKVYIKIKAELFAPNSDAPLDTTEIYKEVSCTEWVYDQVNYSPPISEYKLAEIFPEVTKELRAFILKTLQEQKK